MPYSGQTWHDLPTEDTPITAERLTHIEEGIAAATDTAENAAALDVNGNLDVPGRILQVGPAHYPYTDLDGGGPNSAYAVVDKANTASDASLVLRDQGAIRAEAGLAGDNDLHLKTASGAAGAEVFADRLVLKNDGDSWFPGDLGVGTVPTERIHVSGDQAAARVIAKIENAHTGAGSSGVELELVGEGVDWGFGTDAGLNGGNNFFVQDNTAGYPPRMLIDGSGNMAIGTDSPTAKLDVAGGGKFTSPVIVATPSASGHATTKAYVDAVVIPESQVTGLTADLAGKVPTARTVTAGTGLTGGGDLSANRTLAVAYGTGAGTAAQGNDTRLSDARTPTAHAATHASAGSDPITIAESQVTGLVTDLSTLTSGKQPLDADLTAIAALDASTSGAIASDGAGWIKKTYAQFKTALGLTKADVGLGNVDNTADAAKTLAESQITNLVSDLAGKQPLDSDLTTIAGLTATTDGIMQSKAAAWSVRTPAQVKTDLALTKSDVGLGNVDNTADAAKTFTESQITGLVADLAAKYPTASTYLPSDLGYLAWTQDPNSCRDNSALTTAGRVQLTRLIRVPAGSITNLEMCILAAGATLTAGQCFAALYSVATGALLGTTADQAAAWVSTGSKTMPISGGPVSWAGGDLWVAVFYNGTTGPGFLRPPSGASGNGKAAAASARFTRDSTNTGRTTTMPGTLGTLALDNTFCHWAALS